MFLMIAAMIFCQYPKETNPVKIVINTGISIYQEIIAPGQGDVCNFSPSCSHFTQEAIQRYGPFWGLLMGADRFMRCNPWAYHHYNTYYSGFRDYKIYDPVENNFIAGRIKKPIPEYKIR